MNKKIFSSVFFFFTVFITCFGEDVPRPEYPRPQFERNEWINLNGAWSYEFDFSKSGMERFLYNMRDLINQSLFLSVRKALFRE